MRGLVFGRDGERGDVGTMRGDVFPAGRGIGGWLTKRGLYYSNGDALLFQFLIRTGGSVE